MIILWQQWLVRQKWYTISYIFLAVSFICLQTYPYNVWPSYNWKFVRWAPSSLSLSLSLSLSVKVSFTLEWITIHTQPFFFRNLWNHEAVYLTCTYFPFHKSSRFFIHTETPATLKDNKYCKLAKFISFF